MREGGVFLTHSHDHGAAVAIWLIKKHDPAARTEIEVTYRYTALSSSGEKFIDAFTPEAYKDFITEWRTLLQEYLSRTA